LLPSATCFSATKEDGKAPWDRIELGTVTNRRNESIDNIDEKIGENKDENKEPGPEQCAPEPDGMQAGEEKVQLAADRQTSDSGCRIEENIFILPLKSSSTTVRQFARAAITQFKPNQKTTTTSVASECR
jgi:hypothetical protein